MKKSENEIFVKNEIGKTIRLANSIVEFYEDMVSIHVERTKLLEAENSRLQRLILQSKDLLKAVLNNESTLIN